MNDELRLSNLNRGETSRIGASLSLAEPDTSTLYLFCNWSCILLRTPVDSGTKPSEDTCTGKM
jgi:hypothetical protein